MTSDGNLEEEQRGERWGMERERERWVKEIANLEEAMPCTSLLFQDFVGRDHVRIDCICKLAR